MKEAAGEANMTIITIVLIAIVLAVGTVVVKSLMENTKKSSCCNSLGGNWSSGTCKNPTNGATITLNNSVCGWNAR